MPNWGHLLTNLLSHLGLAIWIGGTVALGALTAPALFRALPRPEAGALFGSILRRFARLRLGALVAVLVAAAVRFLLWEKGATPWIALRWAALAFLAAALLYEIAMLEPALDERRRRLTPTMDEQQPERVAFGRLHRRAERLMKLSLLAALVALLLS